MRRLVAEHAYQVKFVVDQPEDLGEIDRYLEELPEIDRDCVMLMPQGTDVVGLRETQAWLEPLARERGLRYCPRRQVEWFGLVRGT
jgi:hypothetical protein